MATFLKINENDNVAVCLCPLKKGTDCGGVILNEDIKQAHKFALVDIKKGDNIIKYGFAIGHATQDIKKGDWVHSHNLATNLSGQLEYKYNPQTVKEKTLEEIDEVKVFERFNHEVGIRNDLYIVPLVGCVNGQVDRIKEELLKLDESKYADSIIAIHHPYGCSQLGDDSEFTKIILQKIVKHPNAGGVIVVALGCENNQLEPFVKTLGEYDTRRVRFMKAQDEVDEVKTAVNLGKELLLNMSHDKRVSKPLSCIKVGLKCGGSDGFSGITANPLVGMFSDYIVASHGTSVLSEVPEMFGAEQVLMARAKDENTFNKIVKLINDFKDYYAKHNQVCYENPSPGNKEGGITTLEEKSLGCVQKAGTGKVYDVLFDDGIIKEKGLNLLKGPGNDMVACTNLGASSCHLILFTTGRGTPFGGFVPTIKIATNTLMANRKTNWIDFNAGVLVDGKSMEETFKEFKDLIINTCNGEYKTKNEINKFQEIAIFKDGVTL